MDLDRIKTGEEVTATFGREGQPTFALWLQCDGFAGPWHMGVAFREVGRSTITRLEQLAHGLRLGQNIDPGTRWWIFLPTDRATRVRVGNAMRRLRRAAAQQHPLPYGCLYSGGLIDDAGMYQAAPEEMGLICVSLVLAVFEGVGWPLVDRSTWIARELPEALVTALRHDLPDVEYERFLADQSLLVLPSEVAGACLFTLPRVPLSQARVGAEHFEEQARLRATTTAS